MDRKNLKKLVSAMSIEEKALQLTQFPVYEWEGHASAVVTGMSNYGDIGCEDLWKCGTTLNAPDGETVLSVRRRRREKGIDDPFPFMLDVIHGYRTIYPVPLALACSFHTELIEDCACLAATEAKYDGVDITFSPMVDLVRDARWGRVMESGGEDPYWSGEVGKAMIRGYHRGGIACCVKHFAGYGAAEAGREYNTTDISERNLREYYLRSYRACLEEKPEMFMSSFNLLNGKPILGHKEIVVGILRREWGFDGVLISDFGAVDEMRAHGYCATGKECARTAIESGLDIEMSSPDYVHHLPELVREGTIPEAMVDECVLRVLELKDKLGMYEKPDRFTDFFKRDEVTLSEEGRALVRRAAEESCVLLKNNGVLPLLEEENIVLVGPFANSKGIIGAWQAKGRNKESVTIKEGMECLLNREILCADGCSAELFSDDESAIRDAVRLASRADHIIACVGEHMSNSGEAHSRADIRIPQVQRKLLERLHALQKRLTLVVFGGRPLVLSDVEQFADAILYAWHPGTEGGNAIANLLYGKAIPCAKTVMSFPRSTGQCPVYYNCFATGRPKTRDIPTVMGGDMWSTGYDDEYNSPLYPFGYGLSYTKFEYVKLTLSGNTMARGGRLTASVRVKNVGAVDGTETVQWYLRDLFASVVRPLKELKGYERVFLKVGEEKEIFFEITEDMLKFYTESGEYAAELGAFELFVGGNSRDCLKADFQLVD